MNEGKQFIAYEYTKLSMEGKDLNFLLDCYESLGWEQDTRLESDGKHLTLRRSRKLASLVELTRLQRHLEACLLQIEHLEKNKAAKATSAALAAGLAGTAAMAISVFAITAQPPRILMCSFFGIPALAMWALAPILYRKLWTKHSAAASELIRKKQEEIFEICGKGSKLL